MGNCKSARRQRPGRVALLCSWDFMQIVRMEMCYRLAVRPIPIDGFLVESWVVQFLAERYFCLDFGSFNANSARDSTLIICRQWQVLAMRGSALDTALIVRTTVISKFLKRKSSFTIAEQDMPRLRKCILCSAHQGISFCWLGPDATLGCKWFLYSALLVAWSRYGAL